MVHIILILILLFSLPDLNRKYKFWVFSFLILFLFSALRYNFGPDYMSYYDIFNSIQDGIPSWGQSDVLFKQINLWIPNFFLLLALLSFFYTLTIGNLLRRNLEVKDYWFSFLILLINPYLFLVHQSSIRQTISICIVILSINFLVKRDLIKYTLLILIATGFHASAIIVFPVYFLLNEKKLVNRTKIVIIGVLAVLLFTPVFDIVAYKILGYLPANYTFYFEQGLQNTTRATILSSVYFFVVLFNINKLQGREMIYGKLSLIATILSILAMRLSMLTRVGMYFDIFLIVTLPHIFSKIKSRTNRFLLFLLLLTIYILRYYSFFTHPVWSDAYRVYRTIFGHF